jgi:hypothetical protein
MLLIINALCIVQLQFVSTVSQDYCIHYHRSRSRTTHKKVMKVDLTLCAKCRSQYKTRGFEHNPDEFLCTGPCGTNNFWEFARN